MNVSQFYQYSFLALICLGLLIQNFVNIHRYGTHNLSGLYLRFFILSLIFGTVLDVIYGLRESGLIWINETFGYVTEILYSVMYIFAGFFWFVTSELYQRSDVVATRKMRFFVAIPLLIMSVVTAFTPIHHLNFYFENGRYVRGPLNIVFTVIVFILIIWTGISAFIKSFLKKYYMERTYFRIIFLYALVLMLFDGIQLVFSSVMPLRAMGATLVVYIVQQKYIKGNIYVDRLTGSNNRNAAEKYLDGNIERNNDLQVAMIDIDRFKEINDTYGHQAGDEALQLIAKAFMKNLSAGIFFARYGGDEFILVNSSDDTEALEKVFNNTRVTMKELCKDAEADYEIDFSYGIVNKTKRMETVPDILEAADAEMYKVKKAKKAAR